MKNNKKLDRAYRLFEEFRKANPDMTFTQAIALLEIAKSPELTVKELQTKLGLPQSTTSRLTDTLAGYPAGRPLIAKVRDRKMTYLSLAPEGRALLEKVLSEL